MFKFLYQLLFVDQSTGKISHTKFLSFLGGLILCGLFPYVVINKIETDVAIWIVFGTLVLGNRSLSRYIGKVGNSNNNSDSEK